MSNKNISFFLPNLDTGGAERVVVNLVTGLHQRGHNVEVVLSQAEGSLLGDVPDNVSVVDLDAPQAPWFGIMSSLPALIGYLRKSTPDILFSAMNHVNILTISAWRIANVNTRLIISERITPSSRESLKNRLIYRVARYLYPLADEIIANSQGVADDLAKVVRLPRGQIEVVYNPTVTPEVFRRANSELRDPWFGSDEPPVILGVGRLAPQKDFSTLIDAFSRVRQRRNARLIILGEGSDRPGLEERIARLNIEDDVRLPGFVDNPYKYMRSASVFVLSSALEGLPNALIEAMACGCPVVSTDCPSGPSEILKGGKYGPLVPVRDSKKLAEEIITVLDDPIDSDVLRDRAMDFSLESVLDDFEAVLVSKSFECD